MNTNQPPKRHRKNNLELALVSLLMVLPWWLGRMLATASVAQARGGELTGFPILWGFVLGPLLALVLLAGTCLGVMALIVSLIRKDSVSASVALLALVVGIAAPLEFLLRRQ